MRQRSFVETTTIYVYISLQLSLIRATCRTSRVGRHQCAGLEDKRVRTPFFLNLPKSTHARVLIR